MTTILAALQVLLLLFTAPPPRPAQNTLPQSDLLDRLPLPLRSAALYALEAQDHYVRVHTSAGQALIRMRFSDAVAAIGHQEGLRPHRSWWVAYQGIVAFKRPRGRPILELVDGTAVPVSRNAARELGPSFGSE
jgi:DNA-binding LytR/AlgR family response regulator